MASAATATVTTSAKTESAPIMTPDGRRTVEDLLDAYLDDAAVRVKLNTAATYRTIVAHHVIPLIGNRRAVSLRRDTIVSWLNDLEAAGVGDRLREVAYRLVKAATLPYTTHVPLHEHPFPAGKGPRSAQPEVHVWNEEEARRFSTPPLPTAITRSMQSRSRRDYARARSSRWRDVQDDQITVRATLDRKTRTVSEPKTSAGRRKVAIPSSTVHALMLHREQQAAKKHGTGPDDFVFTAKSGRAVGVKNLYHHSFVPLMEKAEVPRISFHALRHTSATLLLGAGVNMKVLQERLGHRDVGVLLRRYAHVMPNAQREAAESIGNILGLSPSLDVVRELVRESGGKNGVSAPILATTARPAPGANTDTNLLKKARQTKKKPA